MRNAKSKSGPAETNQSSDKLLRLLEIMSEQTEPVRLQDISLLCGMNASTTLRFLTALQRRDYVAQDMDTGRYYMTFKICGLAQNVSARNSIRNIAFPFLHSAANLFSESCNLAIESDMSIMYIEVANSGVKTLMSTQRIGNIAPMHCTGVGKLFLSEYSDNRLEQILAVKKLPRFTEHTITGVAKLRRELDRIRKCGYAYDNEECETGARCIAAPIRDYTDSIVAGISISGPTVRMTDEHIDANLPALLDFARQISLRMGWKEQAEPPAIPSQTSFIK